MSKTTQLASILLILVLGMSACNLPSNADATPTQGADAVLTTAAQTVEANLTQAAILNPPTVPVIPTSTAGPPTVTLAVSTNTQPVATNTQICDLALFVKDVSIPDGTEFEPNDTFTKTWQLKNIGTCTWSGYTLVFDSGDSMGGPASTPISSVAPGQEVNLSVDLKAPASDGSYRGYWRIKNSAGVLIPVSSGYQSKSFFVDIKVVSPTPTPTATSIVGDLSIVDIWMEANFKITVRVKTNPAGSLSGNYQYTLYSNGSQVEQGNCTIPSNEDACKLNYAVTGTESIQVVIDSSNSITESNEGNNTMTVTCDKFGFTCN